MGRITALASTVCSMGFLRMVALGTLTAAFLLQLVPPARTMPLFELCGMDNSWLCRKNVDMVVPEVAEICHACGNYWGNVPGFAYCCRCSDVVFEFCLEAVLGGKK